jgi:protoporphyrinogen oxidase
MKTKKISDRTTAIAGAGLTGLMCALKMKLSNPSENIIVFEKAPSAGGMYNSVEYENGIIFDHGMHVIYESCNPEIDSLYRLVMPENDWNIYQDNEKDIAGLFFNGKLQTYSHYIDLRSLPKQKKEEFLSSIINSINDNFQNKEKSALDFLYGQFGKSLAEQVHAPLLKQIYGYSADNLDPFMIKATALDRVIILDSDVIKNLMTSPAIRSRIAFPDQLKLPIRRIQNQKALYPRKFGMKYFIEKLLQKLDSLGVPVLTSTAVEHSSFDNWHVDKLTLRTRNDSVLSIDIKNIIWSAGMPSLSEFLKIDTTDLEFDRGPGVIYVNILLDHPPNMDRLYYFYCYDPNFSTFRVTNYSSYCPGACSAGKYPICVEIWPSKVGLEKTQISKEQAVKIALQEIATFGIIGDAHQVIFASAEKSAGDFPVLTKRNSASFEAIRRRIKDHGVKNILNVGLMAENGLFFLPDVLNHAFSELKSIQPLSFDPVEI